MTQRQETIDAGTRAEPLPWRSRSVWAGLLMIALLPVGVVSAFHLAGLPWAGPLELVTAAGSGLLLAVGTALQLRRRSLDALALHNVVFIPAGPPARRLPGGPIQVWLPLEGPEHNAESILLALDDLEQLSPTDRERPCRPRPTRKPRPRHTGSAAPAVRQRISPVVAAGAPRRRTGQPVGTPGGVRLPTAAQPRPRPA